MCTCDHMLPDHFEYIAGISVNQNGEYQHEHPACLLKEGHEGAHLCRFSDGVIIEWEYDRNCVDCAPEEIAAGECECFTYLELSKDDAVLRLQLQNPTS